MAASKAKKAVAVGDITEDTLIETGFVCSEKHRAFFKDKKSLAGHNRYERADLVALNY